VYSLGVVLYEMLAGRPPFTAETPVAVARAHVHQELPPIRKLAPAVPPHIAAACQRALAKDPGERPHSAAAFASMMAGSDGAVLRIPGGAFVDRTLAATPTPESTALLPISEETFAGPARSPWYRGRRGLWGFVAALAVLLGVALLWASLSRSPSSTPRKSRSGPGLVIPDVTGLRVAEAKRVLEAAGLRVGDIRPAPKGKPGRVVRTDPPANTITRRGSAVTLYVGAEPEHGDEGNNGDHGNHKGDG
jgi:serine/threonine-protein kinase